MNDLGQRLARLGLSQYFDVFTSEGFDTWETLLDITESDLSHLQVKLGHRRKLQRAIAESRGQSSDLPLPAAPPRATSVEGSNRSGDESAPESKAGYKVAPTSSATAISNKRKYRRHPKPDEHAPERPPSAYVIFSNQVRELLKGQDLSFTEIAKVVGERWQVLAAGEREICERQANGAKEKYYAELADYKKTVQFEAYQKYLEDFKVKHAAPTKGKRSKIETETSTSTRSSSHEQHEQVVNRRLSSSKLESAAPGYQRSEISPSIGPAGLPSGPTFSSKPTSPASQPLPGLISPRTGGFYSPLPGSPRSTIYKEATFDVSSINPGRDLRAPPDSSLPYHPSVYAHVPHQSSSSIPLSQPLGSHYEAPIELPSRRSTRNVPAHLPPLTHEDTTWSSESGHSGQNIPHPGYLGSALPLDPIKTARMLPQPVPSIGPSPSPLDRPPPPGLPLHLPPQPHDYRTQGPLAALVRAGELARVADGEIMDKMGSSS